MYGPLLEALESGATVVTANNRLARNLALAYGGSQLANGRNAWQSPDVFSWEAWLAKLWAISQLSQGRAARLQLLGRTDVQVLWDVIARSDRGTTGIGGPFAPLAQQAWMLLCEWDELAAPEWVDAGLSPDQQLFLRWFNQYRDRCKAAGWVDIPMLPGVLREDIDAGLFDNLAPLVFAGFDVWPPARENFRDAIAERGIPVTISEEPQPATRNEQRVQCLNDDDELETAARWARAQVEADPSLDACVIVPDLDARAAEARRVFMDVFCPDWRTRHGYELPVNFSYGEPLANQPRVAAALNFLSLLDESSDYQRFSLALRTPFLGGGRREAGARALLDLRLRDRLGASFSVRDAQAFAAHGAPGFGELLSAALEAGSDRSDRTPAAWTRYIAGLLRVVQWPGDESLDSVAHQELEAWQELLREFADCSRICGEIDWGMARELLVSLAAGRLHQPEAGSGVVQVMGILEAAGHGFDRLWVTGLAAEAWPRPASLNPLLPFGLQRRCGMPRSMPQLELEYADALIRRLRQSSPETVFSWPAMRDGERLHVCDLIGEIPETESVDRWQESLWRDGMFRSAVVDRLDEDRPQAWREGARAGGGTSLFRLQATCPFRAFLELRLGAKEIDEPVTGIGYKQRGSLAHRVLEDFYRSYRSSETLAGLTDRDLSDCLNELLAQRVRELPGMRRPFMRTVADLETQRILPQLIRFVALDRLRGDFRVLKSEEGNEVVVGPLRVGLKLDRLDELADGSLLVVDYKTGQVKKGGWNPGKPGEMQLPVYATFVGKPVSGIAFAQISAHDVKYDGIADSAIEIDGLVSVDKLRHKFTDGDGKKIESWDALMGAWRDCLLSLAHEFTQGDCSINPRHSEDAEGQFAVLTRVYELPGFDTDEDENHG